MRGEFPSARVSRWGFVVFACQGVLSVISPPTATNETNVKSVWCPLPSPGRVSIM